MDIYTILSSKPHNPHYLNRYIKFIRACLVKNIDFEGYTEKHHICPKADDMFPEYSCFKENPWNKAILTPRQHFIAHRILWKAIPDILSIIRSLWLMSHTINGDNLSSKYFELLREENGRISSENNRKRIENGTHHWLGSENSKKVNQQRIENGTHNWLCSEYQRNIQNKRVEEGTHHFLGGEIQRKRIENGTHHFLGPEVNRKRIENGTHNLLGSVTCFDKNGLCVQVSQEIYHNQTGNIEEREFVHVKSKEGQRRKNATK